MTRKRTQTVRSPLPALLRPLFWDYRFRVLTWEEDRDLVTARVLSAGGWDAIQWLRKQLGDDELRNWIVAREGAGLTPRQLRFWELILHLPRKLVNAWLADARRQVWDRRLHP